VAKVAGEAAGRLGARPVDQGLVIPFFGREHLVSAQGISDPQGRRPHHLVSVVLSKYVLTCPEAAEPAGAWVAYRDFQGTEPYAAGFADTAERPIDRRFSGRLDRLKAAGSELGGRCPELEYAYDLIVEFQALPRVPLLMLFNDADEEFPAHCSLLFDASGDRYLDTECLAMLGQALAAYLIRADG